MEDTLAEVPVPADARFAQGDVASHLGTSEQLRRPPFFPEQDEIVTPAPSTGKPVATPQTDRPGRGSRSVRLVMGLCFVLSLLSLALSGFLLFSLLRVRQTLSEGLDTAIEAIDSFEGEGFQYEYRFERTVPVSASIPIEQDLAFPFKGDIPINTTVKVPIDAGILGTFNVEVPINTSVTIDTVVPVKVNQKFVVSTTIPISMTIPIDVRPDDPAIQELLNQLRKWLIQLQQSF